MRVAVDRRTGTRIAAMAVAAVLMGGGPVAILSLRAGETATDVARKEGDMQSGRDFFAADCTPWYTHFNQPSAQYRNGKTYIVFPDAGLDPAVICYDHNLRTWSRAVKVGKNPLSNDDHGNPALLVDQEGYLHVFYGCHAGAMKYARSARPEGMSSWLQMPDPAPRATYPQVMQMSDGTMYLFYRAGAHTDDWVYRTSDDGGQRWSRQIPVLDGVDPQHAWYASFVKGPKDAVGVGFVWKDDNNSLGAAGPEYVHRYDAYYMCRESGGVWRNAAGERLTVPLSQADAEALCRVYDSRARKQHTGGCSVGVDGGGTPYLLFRAGGYYGATTYDHKLARWNGRKWDIVNVGPVVDCRYADYPRDDNYVLQVLSPNQIRAYVANIMAGRPARTELEQWDSTDGGRTWERRTTILSSTEYPAQYVLIAPKLVADHHPDAYLVFGCTRRYLYGDSGFVKWIGAPAPGSAESGPSAGAG